MPRVSSQKAAKDYPGINVKKGEIYFKWSFRYGGTRTSKTYPRASQLTQSKYSNVYAALESLEDTCADETAAFQDIVDAVVDAASQIHEVEEEYNEADEAMGGHQGVNYERAEACQQCASDLDDLANQFDSMNFGKDEEYKTENDARDELIERATSVSVDEV